MPLLHWAVSHLPARRIEPSRHDEHSEDDAPRQDPQDRSHFVQLVPSKNWSRGQYSIQRPFSRTGRSDGHVRQVSGDEHVEQSGEQAKQVPLDGAVFEGQRAMQAPFEANEGAGHWVHVVDEPMQAVQLASQPAISYGRWDERSRSHVGTCRLCLFPRAKTTLPSTS